MDNLTPKNGISLDTAIRYGVYIVGLVICYANMSAKTDYNARALERIEKNQIDQKANSDVERKEMYLQIQTCQTRLAIMEQQLKDLENAK